MANMHDLKTWPDYFSAVRLGIKTFELRRDDRGFRAGDYLRLREFHPDYGYSGAEIVMLVTYVLPGGQFGLMPGWVCMGVKYA